MSTLFIVYFYCIVFQYLKIWRKKKSILSIHASQPLFFHFMIILIFKNIFVGQKKKASSFVLFWEKWPLCENKLHVLSWFLKCVHSFHDVLVSLTLWVTLNCWILSEIFEILTQFKSDQTSTNFFNSSFNSPSFLLFFLSEGG